MKSRSNIYPGKILRVPCRKKSASSVPITTPYVQMGIGTYVTMEEYKKFCEKGLYGCLWPPNPQSISEGDAREKTK